jgi:hypothetical protein
VLGSALRVQNQIEEGDERGEASVTSHQEEEGEVVTATIHLQGVVRAVIIGGKDGQRREEQGEILPALPNANNNQKDLRKYHHHPQTKAPRHKQNQPEKK